MLIGSIVLSAAASPPPPVASTMHERFAVLTEAREHVIQGRLEQAQASAKQLLEIAPPEGLPGPWRPFLVTVQEHASKLAVAPDLNQAAALVAQIAVDCADCHTAMGGGPTLEGARDIPPQRWDAGQNMPLHRWAVDWMWLGLLADDDSAWLRGAAELDKQPLVPKFEDAPPPGGKRELEQLVYVMASKALTTDDLGARGELFGTLIATCAQCHVTRPTQGGAP